MELRDGGTARSSLLGLVCGTQIPTSVVSSGNVIYVRFRTDSGTRHGGFQIKYRIGKKWGCYLLLIIY